MNEKKQQQIRLSTPKGEVAIRSFCTPTEIRQCSFEGQFGTHAQFKSLYTKKESLEKDAAKPDANVVLALTEDSRIVGFGVLAYPDEGERWSQLGSGRMIEVRVIEVSRSFRSVHIASEILKMMMTHPEIEEKIAYMVGYSWTWDSDGTGLNAQAYRKMLIKLFSSNGFQEMETNEPNICLKHENLFMCRVGNSVPAGIVDRFGWLRFGIAPEPTGVYATRRDETETIPSLFKPLIEEKLTGLGIYFDWKTGQLTFRAAREWGTDIAWQEYNRSFSVEHPLAPNGIYFDHERTVDLYRRYALDDYLDAVVGMMKKGRHMGIECFLEPRRKIRVIHFMHSNTLGRHNICHALRSGGICRFEMNRPEVEIIHDGLNLSRAMSFKNAGARLPFGGARIALQTDTLDIDDHGAIGFLAYVLDRSRSFVGPDMGFPPDIADIMHREGYSLNMTGGYDSKIGPPGASTAFGVYLALKEAAYSKFGTSNLAGKKVVVQGAGAVGFPLVATYLAREEALIYVADISNKPVDQLRARFPGKVHSLPPEEVLTFHGDILIPCAVSGIIDAPAIDRLNYKIVLGAANNTLKADSPDEEIRLAGQLDQRGIYFQIDWLHNTAGIIGGAEEYLHRGTESMQRVLDKVEKLCRDGVRENMQSAAANGLTPTEQAYRYYNALIYQ